MYYKTFTICHKWHLSVYPSLRIIARHLSYDSAATIKKVIPLLNSRCYKILLQQRPKIRQDPVRMSAVHPQVREQHGGYEELLRERQRSRDRGEVSRLQATADDDTRAAGRCFWRAI